MILLFFIYSKFPAPDAAVPVPQIPQTMDSAFATQSLMEKGARVENTPVNILRNDAQSQSDSSSPTPQSKTSVHKLR